MKARLLLIVDDDESLREALCELLSYRFRTVGARHGQAALDYLVTAEKPALILLDLMMPVMDGWQFRSIQQKDPRFSNIPVIVMSASRSLEARPIDALRLLKPFDLEQLLELIDSVLGPAP